MNTLFLPRVVLNLLQLCPLMSKSEVNTKQRIKSTQFVDDPFA